MRKLMLICAWLCAVMFVVAVSPARAQNNYTYVSVTGDDHNDCASPATACQSFVNAIDKTLPFGEIICVNSGYVGGYVVIDRSITIDCAGNLAAQSGILTINGPGIIVRLRNLSIDNIGSGGGIGVDAQDMAALYIENCVISNSTNARGYAPGTYVGIKFEPSANAKLFVTNSIISNNGDSSASPSGGIDIIPASGVTATVSISNSEIAGNYFGIIGDGRSGGIIRATISDSVVSGNSENGITAISSGSGSVRFLVDQTKVTGNLYGLVAGGAGSTVVARNSSVFDNATGLFTNNSASLYSYGNNSVNGNATNGQFTGTAAMQ